MDAVMDKGTAKKVPKKAGGSASAMPGRTDPVVTARVPAEIRDQGNKVLKKIGSTPTELVNAAYQYVIDHEALPTSAPSLEDLKNKRRTLTPEQKEKVQKRMRETRLNAPEEWEAKSFKELLDEAREERYARFA
ncbi:type II toxin-antitoxin system RelB/DinJ family antitoxin [Arabiibacter massiliensis]|uniref:type II toxin-antitoxin system RelB/DinJ family antitoxin n=1 Tax=Arabiibacter massiliensis TaxID=1870985 RepID=UPI001E349AFF|nr:type II toxin-antitoxin system RelB/DinJ family antitoxin [Arabiibacter massiliensis]